MEELIKRQDAIDVVSKAYRHESDRITALQELPIVEKALVCNMEKMTLDEAIEHLDDILQNKEWECEECKNEHIQLKDWLDELKAYKVLEEQGKLMKLPCAVGNTVWRINKGAGAKLMAMRVQDIRVSRVVGTLSVRVRCYGSIYGGEYNYLAEDIGRIVFLTREEAEDKLAEMEGKK